MSQFNSCTRCQFLQVTKDPSFIFNKETFNYDIKVGKPVFTCSFAKRHLTIDNPNVFCCDNFQIKDDEELAKILELMKTFEQRGW